MESHREDKVRTFIDIKLVHGDRLSHSDLSNDLEYSQRLPLHNIIGDLNAIRFYDDRPPVTYTMGIIWEYISSAKIPIEKYRERKAFATIPVEVNIDELLEEMRGRFAPPNNPTVSRKDWIREALNEFVSLGLANKKNGGMIYEVQIRKRSKKDEDIPPTDFLLNLRYKEKKDAQQIITIDSFMKANSADA